MAQVYGSKCSLHKTTHEVPHAMHVIQDKRLARPVYRQYLKLADEGTSVTA